MSGSVTKVLNENGIEYNNQHEYSTWISTESNIKCGDVRFFNSKLYYVDFLSPIKKEMFKPQTYKVYWKEYELNNRYRVQDVEERLDKRIDDLALYLTNPLPAYTKFKDDIFDIIAKMIVDVSRFKQFLESPSPWASAESLTELEIAVDDLKARYDNNIKDQDAKVNNLN